MVCAQHTQHTRKAVWREHAGGGGCNPIASCCNSSSAPHSPLATSSHLARRPIASEHLRVVGRRGEELLSPRLRRHASLSCARVAINRPHCSAMASLFASLRRKTRKSRRTIAEPFPGVSLHILAEESNDASVPFPGVRFHAAASDDKTPENVSVSAVQMHLQVQSGFESVQGPVRPSMEDTVTCEENLCDDTGEPKQLSWFGVYDGHSGADCALLIQSRLHRVVASSTHCKEGNIEQALLSGFLEMDQEVLRTGEAEGWRSGATVSVAVVSNSEVYTANVGDSLIVLAEEEKGDDGSVTLKPHVLAEVHKASVPAEKQRIVAAGGMVMRGRVYGDLAISRALGDAQYKKPVQDADYVSAIPHTQRVRLKETHPFLVLASDGLWDKISPQETVNLLHERIKGDPEVSPATLSKFLSDMSIEKGSGDNVSVVVVRFVWGRADECRGDEGAEPSDGSATE